MGSGTEVTRRAPGPAWWRKMADGRGQEPAVSSGFSGADDGDRTRDPQLGKLMLYQLSYVRVPLNDSVIVEREIRGNTRPLVGVLAAGCGGHKQSKAEKAKMNAEFARLDYAISTSSPRSLGANQSISRAVDAQATSP